MKNLIKLTFREETYNYYLIDVDLIEYVEDSPSTDLGSFVHLKGHVKPLNVLESVDSVFNEILKLAPKQTPSRA